MAEASSGSGSEIVFDFFCELCIDDSKQVEAEGYCVDCREYLCGSCYSGHKKTRTTRNHELQDNNNMPKDTPLSTDRVSKYITTKCKVHSDRNVEYYCKAHAVLGCANCFVTDHRKCADIESVAQASENSLESQWFKDLINNLQLIQNKSRDIEARARENKAISQVCCTDVISLVRKLKEEASVVLNNWEQSTVTLAEKIMSEDEETMDSVVEDCKTLSEKVEQLSSEFLTLYSYKRACQLYINMRETEDKVKTHQEDIGKLEEANIVRKFTFEPSSELTSLLGSPNILGTITYQYQRVRTSSPVEVIDSSNITATKLADIRVRSKTDSSICTIAGSAVVSKNRLVICDWNNCKVKLLDISKGIIINEQYTRTGPWDITVFNGTQAAVTLPYSHAIIMMKVSPSLTEERVITVRDECRGIAYSQDRLLVTFSGFDNPRLEIIDLRGNVIRTIENCSDGSKLFRIPYYVCVSRDGETVYISDLFRKIVISITFDGVVKALYKLGELTNPWKVCTDNHGNVLVCGSRSNVNIITADGKTHNMLTGTDGLCMEGWSISHCQHTNKLFIGLLDCDTVKVFQLKA